MTLFGVFLAARLAALFAVVALLWGMLIERRAYVHRHVVLPEILAPGLSLTVLHLSDVHLTAGQQHRERFIRALADTNYDVVVATGDLLGGPGQESRCAAMLAPLTATRPGIAVLGSHDLYASTPIRPWQYFTGSSPRPHGVPLDTDMFLSGLTNAGWRVLRGQTCQVDTPAGPVTFGGFDDPHLAQTVWPTVGDLTVDGQASVSVGVVHAPYTAALDLLVDAGYDLLLAGHTHGGQVRIPGVGALTVNCDLPRRQGRGMSRYRDRWLHVSAGVGHDPSAPYRFACRPEVTFIHLTGPS